MIWVQGRQQPVGLVAALLPQDAWMVLSAGEGSKGPRLYEWAGLHLPSRRERTHERARWALIRRSLSDPSKRAYYRAAGRAQTTLPELVRVAGNWWRIEEGYEQAKGGVGLTSMKCAVAAWYRYITLALLAHAALVVMQRQSRAQEKKVEEPMGGSS